MAYVNPVEFMQDMVVAEGTRPTVKTDADKEAAFKQMLVEEIFLKETFSSDASVYKPEPEDGEETLFSAKQNVVYEELMRKQLASQIVQQGFLREVDSGQRK